MRSLHTTIIKSLTGIFLSGFLISLPAYSAEVDLLAEIEPTLQVIVPTSVSLNLTPNLDGSPVFVSRDLNILVATNNPTGYHLSLQTDSTNLTNNQKDKDGNYPVLETISSELSEENFTTNRWGYKKNNDSNNPNNNYLPFTTNINLNSTTSPTNRDDIVLTFGAKADITKPAGTYSLALNFHAVTNMIPGVETIIFNPNGGEGTMANQQIEAGTSQNLNQNQFTRTDHVFIGWNTEADGSGTSYNPNELYNTALTTENKTANLYAVWAPPMQTFTLADCKAKATDKPYIVNDARDSNTYTVRYIDNNCWMTRNLRIALGETISNIESNISSADFTINASLSDGDSATDARAFCSNDIDIGCWYNYTAPSAGTIVGNLNTTDSTFDICPKGWRLPTNSEQIEVIDRLASFSPIESGTYYSGNRVNPQNGYWWSSTTRDSLTRYCLEYSSTSGEARMIDSSRFNGHSIRCIRSN